MKKVTRREYEQELNQLYSEVYDEQFLIKHFIYMTVKTSINEKPCKTSQLAAKIHNRKVGELIRKYDPTLFNLGYNDFKREH